MRLTEKIAFQIYELCWRVVKPALFHIPRIAQGFKQRSLQQNVDLPRADIWIQAASAGEAYLAIMLSEHLSITNPINSTLRKPDLSILITTNTTQGMEILNKAAINLHNPSIRIHKAYFPFDQPSIMEKAAAKISPKLMVLLETELWPGLLLSLKKRSIKIFIINGRMTEKSLKRYSLWLSFWRSLAPDMILATSEKDAKRFAALFGNQRVEIMQNMKFDRICSETRNQKTDTISSFCSLFSVLFIVLGSIRKQEESDVLKMIRYINNTAPNAVIGLFPRHMHRLNFWKKALDSLPVSWRLRSSLLNDCAALPTVILWDVFGELVSAYSAAQTAFVGGSLAPLGGQNFLEPLLCGIVPVIGTYWDDFYWIGSEIIEKGLVKCVSNWKSAAESLLESLNNPAPRYEVRQAALEYIKNCQGGTIRACRFIERNLTR